jgi:hypothetical protein
VQFLDRSVHGTSKFIFDLDLKFPTKPLGYIGRPEDKLYSKHYKPIVKDKRSFNETYELRTSMFGDTWVDEKRDKIIDEYKLQANPFRTPMSNSLIATMRTDRRHYHKF